MSDFTFQHLETEEDIEQNLELQRKVFSQDPTIDAMIKKFIYSHPKMTLKNHYIMKHKGKAVATLNLIPLNWSIGGVPLKVAEMGNVATLPEYRNLGLIRRLVAEYHKDVESQGYDLSTIEGIPGFYRQFGYDYALTHDEEASIPVEKLPDCESRLEFRPFVEKDIPAAETLLAESQRKFLVHSARDDAIWRMQQATGLAGEYGYEAYTVESSGGMVAYFRVSGKSEEKQLILREATDTSYPTTLAILGFLKTHSKKQGYETLVARTSYQDSISHILASLGAQQRPPYAWQIRITDPVSLLRKMRPLFELRIAASEYRGLTEKLNINFRRFRIQLTIEDGSFTGIEPLKTEEPCAVGLNPPASTQLILGHRSRQELEQCHPDFIVRPTYKRLIDVLFPKLPSYIHVGY
jgi:predicted acetyltransferase